MRKIIADLIFISQIADEEINKEEIFSPKDNPEKVVPTQIFIEKNEEVSKGNKAIKKVVV